MDTEIMQYLMNNSFAIFAAGYLLVKGSKDSERNNTTMTELKSAIAEMITLVRSLKESEKK